jgi:hypothetical protein
MIVKKKSVSADNTMIKQEYSRNRRRITHTIREREETRSKEMTNINEHTDIKKDRGTGSD